MILCPNCASENVSQTIETMFGEIFEDFECLNCGILFCREDVIET